MTQEKLGTITLNANGLRKLANAMDGIYTSGTKLDMSIWKDEQGDLLFMQLGEGTGEIKLVD